MTQLVNELSASRISICGDVALPFLITHVLVHEIGHHFGLSDDAMHAIEETAL